MKSRSKVALLAATVAIAVALSACGLDFRQEKKDPGQEQEIVLTERQKEILRENGLPEDYAALSDLQKSGITAIEHMLTHLEDTYHEEFVYNGYVPPGGVDPEYLTAYRKADPQEKLITVYRSYDGSQFIYRDDYQEVVLADAYEAELADFFAQYLPRDNFWLETSIDHISDREAPLVQRAGGNTLGFIKGTNDDWEEMKKIGQAYGEWLVAQNSDYPAGVLLYVQAEEDFRDTDAFNYSDRIHGGRYLYLIDVSVSSDGVLHMRADQNDG